MRKYHLCFCLIFVFAACFLCCSHSTPVSVHRQTTFNISAEPWSEVDNLFRSDAHWLGGDGASTVGLGRGRVLWLFGDSFINQGSSGKRRDSAIVRNSIAIQKGYNPSSASVNFCWNREDGRPVSFFRRRGNVWYWPGDGIRIKDKLIIFLMEICESENELRFDVKGWRAVLIANLDKDPDCWRIEWLETPEESFGVIIGSACVISDGDYVYAFSTDAGTHDVYLVRWPVSSVIRGDLSNPRWWVDTGREWVSQDKMEAKPFPLFSKGQMEFTVHYEPLLKKYLQIQTLSFLEPDISFRWAGDMTGPWSLTEEFYGPVEAGQTDILIYAGKSHPALTGADIVLTYAVNSENYKRLLEDNSIYYPVFLKGKITIETQAQ